MFKIIENNLTEKSKKTVEYAKLCITNKFFSDSLIDKDKLNDHLHTHNLHSKLLFMIFEHGFNLLQLYENISGE